MFADDIIEENKEFLFLMEQEVGTENYERLFKVISEYTSKTIMEKTYLNDSERNGDVSW